VIPTYRATLAACAVLLWPVAAAAQKPAAPKKPVADSAKAARPVDLTPRTKGSASAPITVYEMSDFQCPYCKRHAEKTFPELERDYVATGKVRWVFVNFPLLGLHANAEPAAEVAMCSARQGKFWDVHDLLFRTQATWAPLQEPGAFFLSFADSTGLDKAAFQGCLQKGETRAEVQEDATSAVRSGARSTPTFYIEGGLLEGAQPAPVFRQVLDSIYAGKTKK
jgi:protein-disulfide isomerase